MDADYELITEQISPRVVEVRTIIKGAIYKRRYFGYSINDAVILFKKWLDDQNIT